MKKLIQLLLLVPLISFCQEDEKFDGVVKINKYANFIQKAYYPNSPFENPFDSLFVIGGISTASGKKFDIIGTNPATSDIYFRTDMPIQPELYEKFTFNSLRKQLKRDDFSTMQNENGDKNLIYNYILRNIDNLKVLKYIRYEALLSYKKKGSTYKIFDKVTVWYNTKTKKFSINFYHSTIFLQKKTLFYDFYLKFNFDSNAVFYYSYKGTNYSINRKMVNPTDDYIIKMNIEGWKEGFKFDLDKFYFED